MGTPKTLREAIKMAICIGPLSDTPERLENNIKDFIRQKFQIVMIKHNSREVETALIELLEGIEREN
jgi:hypothetical protein